VVGQSGSKNPANGGKPSRQTSLHVLRAQEGVEASFVWLVERFSPLLLSSARYNLPGPLRNLYDPEDLVNDVWLVLHGRLDRLKPREGRLAPVLMKFLTTTLRNKIQTLTRKHIRGKPERLHLSDSDTGADTVDRLAGKITGITTRLAREEVRDAISESLERLSPEDREIVILRGIEQHRYKELAVLLGVNADTLNKRYLRALRKLREELPGSVFEEFEED
jgi:RNA polymerase sigma factor (sigma-70 family)